MASDASEGPRADIIYEIFNLYATWSHDGRIGGVKFPAVKRLLKELDILEGIPAGLVDEFVRQHMLRADQDKDGMLSVQEFMVWFFTEVAASLPFKRNGAAYHAGAPLYNRFVYYELVDSGTGVRRKATGLQMTHFLRMCEDLGVSDDHRLLRNGVQVAQMQARSDRTLGKLEGGTRLQFSQFVHALMAIAAKKMVGLDSIIYKIVGDGSPPPTLGSRGGNKTYRLQMLEHVIPMFIESELEAPLRWTSYECDICGKSHSRWSISDPTIMQAYFRAIGVLYLPHFRHVNARNVRAVFHRYNLKVNKGMVPPLKPSAEQEASDGDTYADDDGDTSYRDKEQEEDDDGDQSFARKSSQGSVSASGQRKAGGKGEEEEDDGPDLWASDGSGPCCCLYKQMTLMEMQTWLKLCSDNRTIRDAVQMQGSSLTPARLEAAFLTCCSIAGVYCSDTGAGVHDRPLGRGTAPVAPRMGGLGHRAASGTGLLRPQTYGTPFDGASTLAATTARLPSASALMASGGSMGSGAPRPTSSHVSPSASGTQWSPAGILAASQHSVSGAAHRPATPTLNFVQFLEAIRLVAEDLVGHPQVLVNVEVALWRILHDMIAIGCPLPKSHSFAWTSAPRRPGSAPRPRPGGQPLPFDWP